MNALSCFAAACCVIDLAVLICCLVASRREPEGLWK